MIQTSSKPSILAWIGHWALENACKRVGSSAQSRIVVVEAHASNDGRPSAPKRACMWRSWREKQPRLVTRCDLPCRASPVQLGNVHAALIHNRFWVAHDLTPYGKVTRTSYRGKSACFGERMLRYVHTGQKGGHRWLAGVWLTETIMNDVHVVAASKGIQVTRNIRGLPRTGPVVTQQQRRLLLGSMDARTSAASLQRPRLSSPKHCRRP